jgi:hypothetical protein
VSRIGEACSDESYRMLRTSRDKELPELYILAELCSNMRLYGSLLVKSQVLQRKRVLVSSAVARSVLTSCNFGPGAYEAGIAQAAVKRITNGLRPTRPHLAESTKAGRRTSLGSLGQRAGQRRDS